jgi:hypothetical protein
MLLLGDSVGSRTVHHYIMLPLNLEVNHTSPPELLRLLGS